MNKRFLIKPATSPLMLGRIFNIVVGLILITVGIINVSIESIQAYMIVLNFILVLLGLYYLISGVFLLAPNSKFIPRVEIDKDGILIKDDIFHRSWYYNWDHLKSINLGIHLITVRSNSGISQSFKLNEREDAMNEEIKSEIIDIGKYKGITIHVF
jgi:hypothetical protein